jgi:single-strand DNA-binding protein
MAGSVNKVILIGNLGRDPEVRHAPDGSRIVQLSVATSESWKDKTTGERKDRTEWHRVVIFNERLGEIAEKYLQKGSKVFLEGQLQTRKWQDNHNVERYTTEVILSKFRGELTLLDSRASSATNPPPAGFEETMNTPYKTSAPATSSNLAEELDDEIPF